MRGYNVCLIILLAFIFFLNSCSEEQDVTDPDNAVSQAEVNIVSPEDGESFVEGDMINFNGAGRGPQEDDLPDSLLIWTSDLDDTIGTGRSFGIDTLSSGIHQITLRGDDEEGWDDSESISIQVIPPPPPGFVVITSGIFTMGSPEEEYGRSPGEIQHTVTLTKDFYISETEVTNRQYADMAQWAYDNGYCSATASALRDNLEGSTEELLDMDNLSCAISFSGGTFAVEPGKEDHPAVGVSWYGAACYCDWLSLKAGFSRAYDHSSWQCNGHNPYSAEGYRLPTEAEWEYACRAGTETVFNTGDCLLAGDEANYNGHNPYIGCSDGTNLQLTVAVGSYTANDFGLYDMHGNAWEWCNEWYDYESYIGGDEIDPVGPSTGEFRVIRGGSAYNPAAECRSASRVGSRPYCEDCHYNNGFRVCRGVIYP